MARVDVLELALDVARRHAEAHARQVRLAQLDWLNENARLVRLESLRQSRFQAWQQTVRGTRVSGEAWQQAGRWQAEIASQLAAQREALQACARIREARLALWREAHRRVDALLALRRRHAERRVLLAQRAEQREQDALSAREVFVARQADRDRSGFLWEDDSL
jgi:flagellar export protein FliJ